MDSRYFSLTSFKNSITSLHWPAILLFLVVDSSGLVLISSIEAGDEDDEGEVSVGDAVELHNTVESREIGDTGFHEFDYHFIIFITNLKKIHITVRLARG